MTTTFFIGDTHFGHKNIILFDAIKAHRPFKSIEEHDEELIKRWNGVVAKNDIVWHLGDVAFGRAGLELVSRLNGTKKLVLGNHDQYPTAEYLRHFHKVYGAVAHAGYLLTHVPVYPRQLEREGFHQGNIHGHLHTSVVEKCLNPCSDDMARFGPDNRYVNVSCEQINLTPISFEELQRRQKNGI